MKSKTKTSINASVSGMVHDGLPRRFSGQSPSVVNVDGSLLKYSGGAKLFGNLSNLSKIIQIFIKIF